MPTTDFLPTVSILSNYADRANWSFNDPENWEVEFSQYIGSEKIVLNSVNCKDLIDSFTQLSAADREAMKEEIALPAMCPEVSQIVL